MTRGVIIEREDRDILMRVTDVPLAAISDIPRQDRDMGDVRELADNIARAHIEEVATADIDARMDRRAAILAKGGTR